ncbi:energy transducer TonB [Parerythrobacter jejuensis]|uniref:TonB family protein n=1 Tax=Parerythrobacter jejuensis TaxID=795812 RepID=A0A845AT37_9SPHN|nr:energy transducer TonB [Parerythrobacter jejuensis]MXP32165.1 TonB family protein [Parerythrobacter jejuensis]
MIALLAALALQSTQEVAKPDSAGAAVDEAVEAAAEAVMETSPPSIVPRAPISLPAAPPRSGPADPYPDGNRYRWFQDVIYPADAYLAEAEGEVNYRLAVADDGSVEDCAITESSGSESLDDLTCNMLVERAKFEPAIDATGNPVSGTYEGSRSWRFRKHDLNQTTIAIVAEVDAKGQTTSCRLEKLEGIPPKGFRNENPCRGLFRGSGPWRDANGEPQARKLTFTVSLAVEEPESD